LQTVCSQGIEKFSTNSPGERRAIGQNCEVISMRVAARHSADFEMRPSRLASPVLLAGRRVALARQVKRQAPSFEWKQVSK
jgi:hypothetical protein